MKILHCCLMEASYDSIPDTAWEKSEEYKRFLPYIGYEKNVYDESALEMTRRNLAQNKNLTADVLFVTGENIRREYMNLKAHGFSRIFQYIPEEESEFIEAFEEYLKEEPEPDLILVGQESAGRRNGTTPVAISCRLQYPCVCNVVDYRIENESEVWIKRNMEEEEITALIKLPAVLVVGETPEMKLKTPKRKDKLPFFHQSPEIKRLAGTVCLPKVKKLKSVTQHSEKTIERRRYNDRNCRFITVEQCGELLNKRDGGEVV